MATMPNCIGLEYEDALAAMVETGVRVLPFGYFQDDPVYIDWEESSQSPSVVTMQIPMQGATILPNSSVILTVSNYSVSLAYQSAARPYLPPSGSYPIADYAQANIAKVY